MGLSCGRLMLPRNLKAVCVFHSRNAVARSEQHRVPWMRAFSQRALSFIFQSPDVACAPGSRSRITSRFILSANASNCFRARCLERFGFGKQTARGTSLLSLMLRLRNSEGVLRTLRNLDRDVMGFSSFYFSGLQQDFWYFVQGTFLPPEEPMSNITG